ncbi:hypothetical protein [Mesorhizobium sp. CO1-1-8]|uniref:hypothetical protein n=1 Tax=Mesorhizobium sp. CO1-1-8 TaxID=2876631 RepID=UPI001CD064E0|nr:hypothetical protein [Mesorhizobium sp. CO1-1-8]MBZ9777167.1 hypothetical protein [Mesorhizobium sp. CO1-1-8]
MLLAHVPGLPMVEGAAIVKRIPHVGRQRYLAGQGTIPPSVGYKLMMNTIKPHGIGIASDVANAKQRFERAELAIERAEKIVAQNIERSGRIRRLVETAKPDR